jgi:hypothetical protein
MCEGLQGEGPEMAGIPGKNPNFSSAEELRAGLTTKWLGAHHFDSLCAIGLD